MSVAFDLRDTQPASAASDTIPCPGIHDAPTLPELPQDDAEPEACWYCAGAGQVLVSCATYSAPAESAPCPCCAVTP